MLKRGRSCKLFEHYGYYMLKGQRHMDMATIHECRTRIRFLSRSEVVQERKELFRIINGDALFPTKS